MNPSEGAIVLCLWVGVIKRVVEEISPVAHYSGVSIQEIPPHPNDGIDQNVANLEEVALNNLQAILYQADIELLKKWLPILCSALKTGKLGELVLMGYAQYATGDHEALRATLRSLEAQFPDEYRRDLINFESSLLRIRNEFTFGNFETVDEIYSTLPLFEDYPFKRVNDFHLSKHRASLVAAFYLQDKGKFNKHFGAIEKFFASDFGSIEHLQVSSFKAMRAFMNGSYLEANEYALSAIKLSYELKVSGAYTPFEAAYILADTYLEFGEDKKSSEISEKYLALAIEFKQYPWITAFYSKTSILKLQEGNINGALSLIRKGRESINGPLFNSNLSFPLDIHEILIRLPVGDIERIIEILHRLPNTELKQMYQSMLEFMKNPSGSFHIIQNIPDENDQDKFRKESFLAMVNLGNPPKAKEYLKSAIKYAEKNGFFRSFLNMPPEVRSLILDIASETPTIFLEKLSTAIREQSSAAKSNPAGDHIPLTKRELDVLRRLGTNEPITKIAASLHISNNTIKTHLKNVYRKLSVESRDEAVARGKELSLL